MRTLFFLLFLCSGCSTTNMVLTTQSAGENNLHRLAHVSIGMSPPEVLEIMKKPYACEIFNYKGDEYEIWFYVTARTTLDQGKMSPLNLTPLTFKNGILIGWGFDYYRFLRRQQRFRYSRPRPAPKPPSREQEEDIELEKSLKVLHGTLFSL